MATDEAEQAETAMLAWFVSQDIQPPMAIEIMGRGIIEAVLHTLPDSKEAAIELCDEICENIKKHMRQAVS